MRRLLPLCLVLALFTSIALAQDAEEGEETLFDSIAWTDGPGRGDVGGIATVTVPEGYLFAGAGDTVRLMRAMGNLITNTEKGFLSPADYFDEAGATWFLVFEFDDIGYVEKADEEEIDADDLLEQMIENNKQETIERKRQGLTPFKLRGWAISPRYDARAKYLEWAIDLEDENGESFVNHNIRLLGRQGVMRVTLVCGAAELHEVLVVAKDLLRAYSFNSGERYSEYIAGDKVWKYGLTGLIAGGGVALAAKAGIFKWLWKLLLPLGVAIAAFFRRIFGSRKKNVYAHRGGEDRAE